ncbi:MAG: RadC family protein [Clostridia bacterium]|nr:RadC family protein [Clostridia bacterium]
MKKDGSLHSGHWERIRKKILTTPASLLTETEVLEAVLQFVFARGDSNEIACRLLKYFGNFSNVIKAEPEELAKVNGIGLVAAEKICMINKILDFYRICEACQTKQEIIKSPTDCAKLASKMLNNLDHEKLYMIVINNKDVVTKTVLLAEGDESTISINPTDVAYKAKQLKAKRVIFAHNHPNGKNFPSIADIAFTKSVCIALNNYEIKIYDHIIIANGSYYSFSNNNLIEQFEEAVKKVNGN